EKSDFNTAYCKICEINLEGTGKAAYGYCQKGYRIPCDKTVKGILYLAYEWILEDLKQYKLFHHQIKSLQAFFHLPKQDQRLYAMQQKNSQQGHQLPENEYTNLLDILTDIKTRILELHNYMRLIYIDLLSKPDRASKKESEKLECLCLNLEEREFLQQIIDLFKNFFALCEEAEETFDTYLDLIYGSELANNNEIKLILVVIINFHQLSDNNSDNNIFKALEDNNEEFMNETEEEDELTTNTHKKESNFE
ncbi:21026_t:CDS:2, partial [Gigaspora margarita]